MRGIERLRSVERTTEPLAKALPELPKQQTILVRLVRIAAYGLGDYFGGVFDELGLTEHSYHALCVLVASDKGSASPSELSELVGTSRPNMSKVIVTLEKAGYISRKAGKLDGRRSVVEITKLGEQVVSKATPSVAGPVASAFSGLDDKEQAELDRLLRKAIVSFDEAKFR
ncbi:MarR family winged helix-turn-helix transcriptional regulator [Zhongshania aliphaticivorans]|uniref:MarR family winged helix-turn-helix transcriptional regulator n=1 Tax=Zhongshania aliphaticivorans TaxID=1470434 RepID=UPI0039C8C193